MDDGGIKRPFRFFAAVDGRRSSEWSIIVDGKTDDEVYLSTRSDFGDLKVSLHSSRYSQHGFTARVRDKLPGGERGALDKWKRRLGKPGERKIAYRVVLPGAAMVLPMDGFHPKSSVLPLSDTAAELVVDLNFVEPPWEPAEDWLPEGPLAVRWTLGRGTALEVTMHERRGTFQPGLNDYARAQGWDSRPIPAPVLTEGPGYVFGWDQVARTRFAREMT